MLLAAPMILISLPYSNLLPRGIPVIATWILGLISLLSAAWTVYRIIREPRNFRNGLWIIASLVFVWGAVIVSELERGSESEAATLLFYGAIATVVLITLISAVYLVINGAVVVKREGLRISTLVPAVVGFGIMGSIIGISGLAVYFLSDDGGNRPILSSVALFVILPVALLAVAIILIQLIAFTMYAILYSCIVNVRNADAVVVLGAGLNGTEPTPLLAARVDHGINIFRQLQNSNKEVMLILSGGQGPDEEISEAEAMARYAEKKGVSREQMMLENRSTTTSENLKFTKELFGTKDAGNVENADQSLVVVTSNYHVLRTASLTAQQGLNAQVVGAKTASYFIPAGFLREFVATIRMRRRENVRLWAILTGLWLLFIGVLFFLSTRQTVVIEALASYL